MSESAFCVCSTHNLAEIARVRVMRRPPRLLSSRRKPGSTCGRPPWAAARALEARRNAIVSAFWRRAFCSTGISSCRAGVRPPISPRAGVIGEGQTLDGLMFDRFFDEVARQTRTRPHPLHEIGRMRAELESQVWGRPRRSLKERICAGNGPRVVFGVVTSWFLGWTCFSSSSLLVVCQLAKASPQERIGRSMNALEAKAQTTAVSSIQEPSTSFLRFHCVPAGILRSRMASHERVVTRTPSTCMDKHSVSKWLHSVVTFPKWLHPNGVSFSGKLRVCMECMLSRKMYCCCSSRCECSLSNSRSSYSLRDAAGSQTP